MMIAFTICSNNYIYKARVLASSIQKHCDIPVFLFLADDKEEEIDYGQLNFENVIFLNELGIPNLAWMKENYSIVELNTAIKPFAFQYLFSHRRESTIFYFDPDVKLYQPLSVFDKFWGDNCILLTPHTLTPLPFDGQFPGENLFLNHGTYNLGFLALKRGAVTGAMLTWWAERMLEKCVIALKEGFFVDQIWFNLVPLYFGNTTIIDHFGFNMSYWNLHERNLSKVQDEFVLKNSQPLVFYHFSNFDPGLEKICAIYNFRYTFADQPTLKLLYQDYLDDVNFFVPDYYKKFKYFSGRYPIVASRPGLAARALRKVWSVLTRN